MKNENAPPELTDETNFIEKSSEAVDGDLVRRRIGAQVAELVMNVDKEEMRRSLEELRNKGIDINPIMYAAYFDLKPGSSVARLIHSSSED